MPKTVKIGNQVIDPENPGIDRPVVIKEFEIDDPGAERAIEMLSYGFACVPKLYHVEKTQNSIKIYQEFIEGTHLYDLNPGTLEQVVEHTREIARALRAVHKQAEAVRDLTPDNIIFRDGLAHFVDLSTTNMEYTPGFKPPEVDGGLTGGYCRASDIYQIGIILRGLLQAWGQESKSLQDLVQRCLAEDPNQRPSAEQLFQQVSQIQNQLSGSEPGLHFSWLIFVLPWVVTVVVVGLVMKPDSRPYRVASKKDVVLVRAKVAELPDSEKATAAFQISQFLSEETLLTTERIDALFITPNPLVICDGKNLGLGSRVRLREGDRGYIVGVNFEGVQIKTINEEINFDLNYEDFRGGFSRHFLMTMEPLTMNIYIREKHQNLNAIVEGVAKHLGLRVKGKIKGSTAGLFNSATIQDFFYLHEKQFKVLLNGGEFSQNAETPPLYFPVQGVWLSQKCKYLELYLGAPVENCDLMRGNKPLYSYSNTLKNMLAVYGLVLKNTNSGYKLVMKKSNL